MSNNMARHILRQEKAGRKHTYSNGRSMSIDLPGADVRRRPYLELPKISGKFQLLSTIKIGS